MIIFTVFLHFVWWSSLDSFLSVSGAYVQTTPSRCRVGQHWSYWSSWQPSCPCSSSYATKRSLIDDDDSNERDRRSYSSYSRYSHQGSQHIVQKRFRSCIGLRCRGKCYGESVQQRNCPVLDNTSSWSTWTSTSACSATCGRGLITMKRQCKGSSCFGKPPICLGTSIKRKPCSPGPCPQWSQWSQFSACSTTCGWGIRTSYRTCSVPGKCRGYYTQTRDCERRPCPGPHCTPINGKWSGWTAWSRRSVSCGESTQRRTRVCSGSSCGGTCKGPKVETLVVSLGCCPVNGTWAAWSDWSGCTATCGKGVKFRNRRCSGSACGGSCDGDSVEIKHCSTCCPVNGKWTKWTSWTECSVSCGGGTRIRSRHCLGSVCGGSCEGERFESQTCNDNCCPVNGTWSDWSDWSTCPTTRGTGIQHRHRNCTKFTCGGYCTGPDTESRLCNTECSPSNGTWTNWTNWTACSVSCGGGSQNRSRTCQGHSCGSYCDGLDHETRLCNTNCCPVNGTWTDWSKWSQCPVTCGAGVQFRQRNCTDFKCGGYCDGPEEEAQPCNTDCCPINGNWTEWTEWTNCSVSCGEGTQNRSRTCHGYSCGGYCDGQDHEIRLCNTDCCPVNGTWTDWSRWSECPVTCGTGVQFRHRNCTDFKCGCEGPKEEAQLCNTNCCPINGNWTEWTEWTNCSVSCGEGTQNRSRTCHGYSCGGYCEGIDHEIQSCNDTCCPVNGTWSDWSNWSECPVTCGTGVQFRHRNCTDFKCGCEGPEEEAQLCNTNCCPMNGNWTEWTEWTNCSVSCGGGTQNRSRTCQGHSCGGYCNGPEEEAQLCNTNCCPINGAWTEWTEWTNCSVTCGGGTQNRSRVCYGYSCGGYCEGLDHESKSCNDECCPVNGTWSDWSNWSVCTGMCGGGTQVRHRNCTNSKCGGSCDGTNSETRICNTDCCLVNGSWTDWSNWTTCTAACGGGMQKRTRDCTGFSCGGFCEGENTDERPCNTDCCPQHGVWTEWSEWSQCTNGLGGYIQNRTRDCVNISCGGQLCHGTSLETQTCDPPYCLDFQQALIYASRHTIYALPLICANNKTSPLLIYSNSSIVITFVAYDPLTQYYYYADQVTGTISRVKRNGRTQLVYTHDTEISGIAMDITDRSLYVISAKRIVSIDVDVNSSVRIITEQDSGSSVATFSQLHGQLALAFSNQIVLISRIKQFNQLTTDDKNAIQPADIEMDEYNDQFLVTGNSGSSSVVRAIDYNGVRKSTLKLHTPLEIQLNTIAVDGHHYYVPVTGGIVAIRKNTLEQDKVFNTGIDVVDMLTSYYAPQGNEACNKCPRTEELEQLICNVQHNYAFEGTLLDVVKDLRTGSVRYVFRVTHIHKDKNAEDSLGVSVESSKRDNDTIDVFSPTGYCCGEIHIGVNYLLIGQAGVNRLHLHNNDALFNMNDLTSEEITKASAQCENIVLAPNEDTVGFDNSLGSQENQINSP